MIYRAEHPKPQFMREQWLNLNGQWQFEIDRGNSGEARRLWEADRQLSGTIQVPFCPESKLSGVESVDFLNSVWYRRTLQLTAEQLAGRVILHFGACDYRTTVYLNGKKCGVHVGGYVSFSFDVTEFVVAGENVITVHAEDDPRDPLIPSGKQSTRYGSYGCYYTRSTGIWQTVWLEFVPRSYIRKAKYTTNAESGTVGILAHLHGAGTLEAKAYYEGTLVGSAHTFSHGGTAALSLSLSEIHLWEVGHGRLYDLVLTYGEDTVHSYFGLRSLTLQDKKFLINGKSVYQRLVLDQGYYPDGIYTAPSEEALIADIVRSQDMGFNGARLHEKVFEERFLYHCDRLGYIVWGEYPNWGLDHSRPESVFSFLPEWLEEVERDYNHPAIVGWCPFNETWDYNGKRQNDDILRMVYLATKQADPTRPCIDTSGNFHVITDIYDLHDYDQDPDTLRGHYRFLRTGEKPNFFGAFSDRQTYDGKLPFFVSEYGGISWTKDEKGWGYGNAPKTEAEFLYRLKALTDVLMDDPMMFGFCYTQLYDVEQEQNGLYTYDRQAKFSPEQIYPIFSRKAAIED